MIHWEGTDQFGNLFIGHSSARTEDELGGEVAEMIELLKETTDEPIVLSVDVDYGQISGPHPEHARYVLQTPIFSEWQAQGQSCEDVLATVMNLVGSSALVSLAD